MKVAQNYLFLGAAACTLLLGGCAGDYWVSAPYDGPDYGAYYGYHHFYGQSFGSRHFDAGRGHGGGFHGGGYHGGGGQHGGSGHGGRY
jgi:hypothetical protein